ncbi:MAG: hypothetical protein E7022_02625 [Desulfovibrio desulfuricans]|nr:hypothetical protein [Desulfovibrio desulfuricans]
MFYHNGHRSNAHLGIHHPFGAKHGTPVPLRPADGSDSRPLHERMYAPSPAELLRRPVPQPPDAPLHDRLYPESYEEYFARIASQGRLHAADAHGSALTDAGGRPFDAQRFLQDHHDNNHKNLVPYEPEPDAPVPYYRVGVRPLEIGGLGNVLYRWTVPFSGNTHGEHMHLLGSDGSNFGMSKDGTGVDGIFSESRDDLYHFQVEPMKFRKDYVDKAKAQVDANWQREKAHAAQRGEKISRYHFSEYNCQQYVLEVLISADKMAKDDGVSLTF